MCALRRVPWLLVCLLVASTVTFLPSSSSGQAISRITQPVDDMQRVVLKGNVHPLARAEFDRGAAPAVLALDRMLLVLKRSPEQEAALTKLLDNQQDNHSPQYRKWLTPDQFGHLFGPSDDDIQKITGWLEAKGFHDIHVSHGRNIIEFSGSASQVQSGVWNSDS